MKKFLMVVLMAAAAFAAGAAEGTEETLDFSSWYAGVSGGLLLPGNGNTLARAAEVSARVGYLLDDGVRSFELEAACAPNASTHAGHEALTGVAVRHLYHLSGFEFFDKLFGCERFDPFVSCGGAVRFGSHHAFADRSHRTALGPTAGFGAFYHLTDNLDLRGDVQAMLGIDSPCGMLYTVCVGLQWTFGEVGE